MASKSPPKGGSPTRSKLAPSLSLRYAHLPSEPAASPPVQTTYARVDVAAATLATMVDGQGSGSLCQVTPLRLRYRVDPAWLPCAVTIAGCSVTQKIPCASEISPGKPAAPVVTPVTGCQESTLTGLSKSTTGPFVLGSVPSAISA